MTNPAFIDAMVLAGLSPPTTLKSGINRFAGIGKHNGNKSGWAIEFADTGGSYGCFASDFMSTWQDDTVNSFSPAELEKWRQKAEESKALVAAELAEKQRQAAEDAVGILDALPHSDNSPYAQGKLITYPDDIKYLDKELTVEGRVYKAGADVVPVYNEGAVAGLQFIYDDSKTFLTGTKAKGGYYLVGEISTRLVVAEGVATALAINTCTDIPTVAAFSAGNLINVAEYFRQLHPEISIVIAADNDVKDDGSNPGVTAAEKAAKAVGGTVAIPEIEDKACDFSDVYTTIGAAALAEYFNVSPATNATVKPTIKALNITELLTLNVEPRRMLLSPILPEKGLAMIYAKRGVGKTQVAVGATLAMAQGANFLRWQAEHPVKVAYIDGEMPIQAMQERFARAVQQSSKDDIDPDNIKFISHDMQEHGLPSLSTRDGQDAFWPLIEDRQVVVVDNISTLCRGGKENDGDDWLIVQEWLLKLRAKGMSVLLIHHAGKGGQQRGTSRREDVLDSVVALSHPSDYEPEQGAKFIVDYEKCRHSYGEDVTPFTAHLTDNDWQTETVEANTYERVIELTLLGLNRVEIGNELAVNRSTVCRHINKAYDDGRLKKPDDARKKSATKSADSKAEIGTNRYAREGAK